MSKKDVITGSVTGLVAIVAIAIFLVLGFTLSVWHPAWLVFLAIPVTSIIVEIVTKKRNISGSVTGAVAIAATAAFLLMGFLGGFWHPGWVVFLAVPLSGIIARMITGEKGEKKEDAAQAGKDQQDPKP
jgi:hypothetical protein